MSTFIIAGLLAVYPVFVYLGLQRYGLIAVAGLLIALSLARLLVGGATGGASAGSRWVAIMMGVGGLALAASSLMRDSALEIRLYPVLMNAVMLAAFGTSLLHPPSLVERIARLREPDLPPEGVIYTRHVTQVWCLFFIINGGIAAYTALFASLAVWTLYNGLIAYLAMGALFMIEYLIRLRVMREVPR
jgi:uncharacterized membrane protein